jgi:hypothetical protein
MCSDRVVGIKKGLGDNAQTCTNDRPSDAASAPSVSPRKATTEAAFAAGLWRETAARCLAQSVAASVVRTSLSEALARDDTRVD